MTTLNVLLLDDIELKRDVICEMFLNAHNVTKCATYDEAIKHLGEEFDLILCDYNLKDSDKEKTGARFCRRYLTVYNDCTWMLYSGARDNIENEQERVNVFGYRYDDEFFAEVNKTIKKAIEHKKEKEENKAAKVHIPEFNSDMFLNNIKNGIYREINEHQCKCAKENIVVFDQRYIKKWGILTAGSAVFGTVITMLFSGYVLDKLQHDAAENALQNERQEILQKNQDSLKCAVDRIDKNYIKIHNRIVYLDTLGGKNEKIYEQ